MTHYKNFLLYTLLCSLLVLTPACFKSSKTNTSKDEHKIVIDVDLDAEKVPPESIRPDDNNLVVDDMPPGPQFTPPLIGPEIPGNGPGYGGGSQGFVPLLESGREEDDDNEDEDEEPRPNGVCGNGVQEVLPNLNTRCPHLVYGTGFDSQGTNMLYSFNINTGAATEIAPITGEDIEFVHGIDFSPQGQLYGIGFTSNNDVLLVQIDCASGDTTTIGDTLIFDIPSNDEGSSSYIWDISFDSQGQLWGFLHLQRYVGRFNKFTGQFLPISTAPIEGNTNDLGDGLTFWPFLNDELYDAADLKEVLISRSNGEGVEVHTLIFPNNATDLFVTAMDNDPFFPSEINSDFNTTYVAIRTIDFVDSFFGKMDMTTGEVSFITDPPIKAPPGFTGIAVNRRYEECDGNAPLGAACIDCQLVEVNCSDGIDNNGNGATDCGDPACAFESCDSGNLCTINAFCLPPTNTVQDDSFIEFTCQGTPVVCTNHDPCLMGICCDEANPDNPDACANIDPPPAAGTCNFVPDLKKQFFGACETDGHACTVGKCAFLDPPAEDDPDSILSPFACIETNRKLILIEDKGCNDGDTCTADSCSESWVKDDLPSNGNVPINTAAVPWGSVNNVDENGNVLLDNDYQCLNEVERLTACVDEASCHAGVCTVTGTGMPGDPAQAICKPPAEAEDNSCGDLDSDCVAWICTEGGCFPTFAGEGTTCDADDACFEKECDGEGNCVIVGDLEDCDEIPTVNSCTYNTCVDGGCQTLNLPDGEPSGKGDCTVSSESTMPPFGECNKGSFRCFNGEERCEPLHEATEEEICFNGLDDNCNNEVDENCANLAFITNTPIRGDFGGVARADALCQSQAIAANRPGIYKAWLSDSSSTPARSFIKSTRPYARVDGRIIANSYADLITSKDGIFLRNPLNVDAFGVTQSGAVPWTATATNGTATGPNCNNWTNIPLGGTGTVGSSGGLDVTWTDSRTINCSNTLFLYCFQQSEYKTVFLTRPAYNGNLGGIEGANAKCQAEGDALFPNQGKTFVAWISDSTQSPASSFVRGTGPYALPDGTIVANSYAELTNGTIRAAINQPVLGSDPNFGVWTATDTSGHFESPDCSGWTSTSGTGRFGNKNLATGGWTDTNTAPCQNLAHLYCFEK